MSNFVKINGDYELDKIYKAKWLDNIDYDARIVVIGKNLLI